MQKRNLRVFMGFIFLLAMCTFLGYRTFFAGSNSLDAAARENLMKKFAPKVYLHEDEKFFPGKVEDWISSVKMKYLIKDNRKFIAGTILYDGDIQFHEFEEKVTPDNISNFTYDNKKSNSSRNFYLEQVSKSAMYGDNDGEVNAPVYVKFYEGSKFYEISYLFWYPHNGNIGPSFPDGASHQGDWERIMVVVDKKTEKIDSVKYNAHAIEHEWYHIHELEFDGTHPVVYSALDSHASYALPSATPTGNDGKHWKIDRPAAADPLLPDDNISTKGQIWRTWNNVVELTNQNWLNYRGRWGAVSMEYKDGPYGPGIGTSSDLSSCQNKIIFYERDNCIGNMRALWNIDKDSQYNIKENPPSGRRKLGNDAIRSLKLLKPKKGTLIRLFDSPDGSKSDDYVEIFVKKDSNNFININSIEAFMDTDEILVLPHPYNGLAGKVSRLEVDVNASIPDSSAVFYEGNKGTQSVVGTMDLSSDTNINLKDNILQNDEIRSIRIASGKKGTLLTFFDSPDASKKDDWTQIYLKKDCSNVLIDSFEQYKETDDYVVIPHYYNGIDGKISYISLERNSTFSPTTLVVFNSKEGLSGKQVGTLSILGEESFKFDKYVQNDEARSLKIIRAKKGSYFRLTDDPDGKLSDDYTEIFLKKDVAFLDIDTLEKYRDDDIVRVIYHNVNGLNGKVSNLYANTSGSVTIPKGVIEFYEGNNISQDKIGVLNVEPLKINFKHHSIENDEARSLRIKNCEPGVVIRLYDNPDGKTNDDICIITIKEYVASFDIDTFQKSFETPQVKVEFLKKNGLDGKVSRIEIDPF